MKIENQASPKGGDILLYRGKGFVSHMIKIVTKSCFSHAAWYLGDGNLLESDWSLFGKKGVQVNAIEKYKRDRVTFIRLNLPEGEVEKAVTLALLKEGQRYDFSLFFSLFRAWLLRILSLGKLGKLRDQSHGWICSELVARPLFETSGFSFGHGPVEEVVPETIWQEALTTDRAGWF